MINITSQYGQTAYNVVKLVLDSTDDLVYLSKDYAPGSTAFIIDTSESYMLNSKKEWKKIKVSSVDPGGGGGDVPGDNDDDGIPDYDGGIVS